MFYYNNIILIVFFAYFGSIYSTSPLLAQITPDSTLGNETSTVTPNATVKGVPADL